MKNSYLEEIKIYRNEIDKIDNELVKLLNNRLEYVKKIRSVKKNSSGCIYDPFRESGILDRLLNENEKISHLLDEVSIKDIYRIIFINSRKLQGKLNFYILESEYKEILNNKLPNIFSKERYNIKYLDNVRTYIELANRNNCNDYLIMSEKKLYSLLNIYQKKNNILSNFIIIMKIISTNTFYLISSKQYYDYILENNTEIYPIFYEIINRSNDEIYNYINRFKNILNGIGVKYKLIIKRHILIIELKEYIQGNRIKNIKANLSFCKFNVKILGYYPKNYYFL